MKEYDLTVEQWRQYEFGGTVKRIDKPVKLYISESGTTHRVLTEDRVIICVPAPGYHGCVLSWLSKNPAKPVEF